MSTSTEKSRNYRKFETNLEIIATEFRENLAEYDSIICIHHTDADGIGSAAIIKQLMEILKKRTILIPNNLFVPWKDFMNKNEKYFKANSAIIFSDLEPNLKLLNEFLNEHPNIDVYILDHHLAPEYDVLTPHENIYNCNPTQYALDGLKEIVGTTLNYLFAREVTEKIRKFAWIPGITMFTDTLQHFDELKAYNRQVAEDALETGIVEIREGLCLFGGQHERLDKALAMSILPYIPQVEADRKKAKSILESIGIPHTIKVEDLSDSQIERLVQHFDIPRLFGEYLIVPRKKNLLRYGFEHAEAINVMGYINIHEAFSLLSNTSASKIVKEHYDKFIGDLTKNLAVFVRLNKSITEEAIIVDFTDSLSPNVWSDIASFSTINKIYDPHKVLLCGGIRNKGTREEHLKLSVRCTKEFIQEHGGIGANQIIYDITAKIGGTGGGHKLAGAMRLPSNALRDVINNIDAICKKYRTK